MSKSEIRIPKSETNSNIPKTKCRNELQETSAPASFHHSQVDFPFRSFEFQILDLFRISDLDIRIYYDDDRLRAANLIDAYSQIS